MFDVFLSHNGRDKRAVEVLANRLKEEARLEPFLDRWHLLPGGSWQPELEQVLTECPSVAVFFGESGVSPWQHEELQLAITQAVRTQDEYRVIPVLLPGSKPEDVKGFLAQRTWVDFRSGLDDADAFNRLVAGIKGQSLEGDAYRLPDEPAPYRGLLPFDRAHARFFFGRDSEIQTVLDKLKQHPFVVVVGASGAGKSSLVLGGVLPRLEEASAESGRPLRIRVMTPGGQPLRALANQLATLVPPESRLTTADALTQRLASRAEAFRDAVDTLTAEQPGTFLLVVDQLEELFTHAAQEEASKDVTAFVSTLREAVEKSRGSIRVIATLRADFFERCLGLPMLRALMQDHQVLLGSLGPEALRDAIVRPAQAVGAFLEKGLVGTILKDVSQAPGTLPLLEHALYELWRARRGAWLTLSAYEANGGVSGALQRRAQSCYEALKPEEQELARRLFLRLTALGEGAPDTRRRVARGELRFPGLAPEQVEYVLQVLSGPETRLVIADGDTVEVAHEVIIREWPTLRGWLDENRRDLRVHRRLTEAANEWEKQQRDPSYLYTGSRLLEAEERFASNSGPLNQRERDFLEASLSRRDAENREEDRRKRRELERAQQLAAEAEARRKAETERALAAGKAARHLRWLSLVLAIAAIGISVFWKQAQRERDNARARELTTRSLLGLKEDPQRGLRLIQEAWGLAPSEEIASALTAWRFEPGLAVLRGHSGPVTAADFSPDGSRLLTASEDKTARLWNAATGEPLATFEGHSATVSAASFSPDGSRVLTVGYDATARLWESASGKPLALFKAVSDAVTVASFSPDGSRVLLSDGGSEVQLWDAATGKPLAPLAEHLGPVSAASFSPDGSRVLTTSHDKTARLWDAATGKLLVTLEGHSGKVLMASFSPDGSFVLTASEDKTARLWDAATGKPLALLEGHASKILEASFSPDGSRLLTISDNASFELPDGFPRNAAHLRDAATGTPISVLVGHTGEILTASFSPDSSRVLTASLDGTARLWDAATGKPLALLEGHAGAMNTARFSPDGFHVLTTSQDGMARLWEAASGKVLAVLEEPSHSIGTARFSPDGSRILTTSRDGMARLWITARDKASLHLGHTVRVEKIHFSPDGSRILTVNDDKTVRLWETTSGRLLAPPPLEGHVNELWGSTFSPDGSRLLVATTRETARLWNAATGKPLATLEGHSDLLRVVRFSPDGSRILTASDDTTARLWEGTSGKLLAILAGHSRELGEAGFSPDGSRVLTASYDNTARLWDGASGKPLSVLEGHSGAVDTARFSPDGSRILTASRDGTARLWDGASGKPLALFEEPSHSIWRALFSPDGSRILTVSQDGTARLWDGASGNPLALFEEPSHSIWRTLFSPDGSRILTADKRGTARLWDTATGKPLATLEGHSHELDRVSFSADGSRILATSGEGMIHGDGAARLWEATTGKLLARFEVPSDLMEAASFSPDGSRLLTIGTQAKAVHLWDATSGTALATLDGHAGPVMAARFSPDGSRVLTASHDGTARLWSCWIWAPVAVQVSLASQLEAGRMPTCDP